MKLRGELATGHDSKISSRSYILRAMNQIVKLDLETFHAVISLDPSQQVAYLRRRLAPAFLNL